MSYSDLSRWVTFRPIDVWPGEPTRSRQRSPFSASWSSTILLLIAELGHLGARNVVMQVAVSERDIRADGLPRADARPSGPGVVLAFESKHGPLKYAVDTFTEWRDNVRAIALALEALRKVDRYGVTRRGEQYTGWKAIPVSTDPVDAIQTREQARAVLAAYGGDVRAALRATHPDTGGDELEFRKVIRARDVLAGRPA